MARFLLKRLFSATLTLFAVSVLTFLMFFALPRDPVSSICSKNCNPERLERVRDDLGLNDPLISQYAGYMKGIVTGRDLGSAQGGRCDAPCLGWSYVTNEAVSDTIARVLPVTLSIVIPAAILWLLLGVGLGMVSALRRGTWLDRLAIGFSLTGASLQLYFVGAVLLLVFVYNLRLLPVPSYTSIFDNPAKWASGLVLAWVALAFLFSAIYARLSRAQMLETLSEDFVRTARAKGLAKPKVYGRHALRAAITPVVTIAGLDVGGALGGTVITETTFGIQGLGRTAVDAVRSGDLPTIMATVLIAAVFVVLANVLVDLLYAAIDPRVRLR
ncbi:MULTISPECIES: ABC transporter permease [Micromonospora]|uniref:Peptide transport system permease prote in n=2 Tax=Micromonospora TaxID=1873 RepID=A0A1C4ZN51_9ACTN|nr:MULTISPECIES: ABC transporter permease [Micromonospora]RAN96019.1 putative peptide transport system permease prote in [Micromonospora saelicesensis]RAO02791.1 putative peptide transport system permease prote in [Micromonospora noduli]RAO15434.1 putative peptide transport system permease prote in [Micromonospora noduli]RAO19959.1 putative peptide transport system permease prote in [Micromonospora noduli]RAO36066.1 putative peptide transport system permease prote in [Micromonospora saelicesen